MAPAPVVATAPVAVRRPSRWPALTAFALCSVVVISGIVLARTRWPLATPVLASRSATPIEMVSLHAQPRAGHLAITWNGAVESATPIQSGELFIHDGERNARVVLSPEQVRSGTYSYAHAGKLTQVRLILRAADGREFQETTVYRTPDAVRANGADELSLDTVPASR
jgi:hypothetical protein